ncbi:anti-sigma factor antagonist [Streptomyces dangxiongensis]|uniref:Anti-sigma factor antagonist n=1 Tax=Streptomyces dangxiongensis TaxID=1442032 RepID=A0A3G2JQK7_9ACTN|nr:STAS domain-containing protein [Streptomyces dangxiongensis]AYN43329.1 anti-sigma factor antagonist [Streptomyces dangxiongensis]
MTPSPGPEAHTASDSAPQVDADSLLPTGPTLALASRRGPRHAVVAVDGAIDYHTAPQLLGHLATTEMQKVPLLILDLTQADFCDSSALGAFVEMHRRRSDAGHRFALTGVQPEVRRILELTRLTSVLPLHETVKDVLSED